MIAVLHDLAAAEAFADRMLVIHHGKQGDLRRTRGCAAPQRKLSGFFGMTSFRVAHPVSGKALRIFLKFLIALNDLE